MRCQACLGSLNSTPGNSTMTTRCGHLFHINCIDSWLNDGNQTCPRCRSMISRNELIQLYPETLPRLVKLFENYCKILKIIVKGDPY